MEVLIVGGSGFMGGRAAARFRDAGHRVTVLSRGVHPPVSGVESLVADRRDASALGRALEGRRFDFTADFVAFDAGDIERLLLIPYAVLGRYALISSGQVYLVTEGAVRPYAEDASRGALMAEPPAESPDHEEWAYGLGKRRAESALLALRSTHGVRGVALRLPVVQGEGDPSLRLWAYLERMLDGGPVLLPDGAQRPVRFVYAGDVANALLQIAEGAAASAPAYNLAQPDVLPLRVFLERVASAAGLAPVFVEAGWDELTAGGLGDAQFPYAGHWSSVPDPSRATVEWGFAGTRVDDYLPGVVRWHLEHRPAASHPGYAARERELEFARRRTVARA